MTTKQHFQMAKYLVRLLDTQFTLAGFKFGLDPILGFVPELGNIITTSASFYLFYVAWRLQVPRFIYLRMFLTVLTDFVLTAIPFIGNIFDFIYKSNEINLRLLSDYLNDDYIKGEVIN